MLSMSEVAAAAGVASYRIKYALETGALKEPKRLAGRRCFTPEDLTLIKRYFATGRRASADREDGRGKDAS